jgi:hypothetical protein
MSVGDKKQDVLFEIADQHEGYFSSQQAGSKERFID